MKRQIIYTSGAKQGLREALTLIQKEVGKEKALSIRKEILDKTDTLKERPQKGQIS